jgi:hypothetical protein
LEQAIPRLVQASAARILCTVTGFFDTDFVGLLREATEGAIVGLREGDRDSIVNPFFHSFGDTRRCWRTWPASESPRWTASLSPTSTR